MPKLKAMSSGIRDFWLDHIWTDLVIAGALVTIHLLCVGTWSQVDILGAALPADRRSVYSATAIVVSLLGSFTGIAIGQLSSAKGNRADALRSQGADILARNWRSVFRAAMLSALVAIIALLLDPSKSPEGWLPVAVRWAFELTLLIAVVKFVRLSSLFFEVLMVAAKSAEDDKPNKLAPAPEVSKYWANKQQAS
ncbi:hypothetical protein [Leifsonia sp. ALI-44-B]|uniref:hypothetical protein n=1 Tax=Leifsonia sp. ALI-44-B TaxID=1933776 RepID=UPI00117BCFBF|nr:hypothetical protein [Leifsonia sp. ALI-44-B]